MASFKVPTASKLPETQYLSRATMSVVHVIDEDKDYYIVDDENGSHWEPAEE